MHLALRRRRTGVHHLAVRATRRMPSPSLGRRMKARAGGHRAVGNEWERLASAGARGTPRLLPEVRCTWCGPLLYLVWTRDVPGVPFPLVLAVPGRRTAVLCKPFSRSRGTGLGGRGGCVLRADAIPALARGRRAGGPGPRRACRLPVLCARAGALPGERAVAQATARHTQGRRGNLPGTGSPATGRPVPCQSAQPACVRLPAAGGEGRRPGSGAEAGSGQQNWQCRERLELVTLRTVGHVSLCQGGSRKCRPGIRVRRPAR
jgi:hypothetical protein